MHHCAATRARDTRTGLEIDPSNAQLKEGLEAAQKGPEPAKGDGLFGPQFMAKLAMDPTTRGYLQQPDFMQMLRMMQQNPSLMSNFMSDPRFSKALSVRPLGARRSCPLPGSDAGAVQNAFQNTGVHESSVEPSHCDGRMDP